MIMAPGYLNGVPVGCGSTVNADNGLIISSPDVNGDGLYENNVVCQYVVQVTSGLIR